MRIGIARLGTLVAVAVLATLATLACAGDEGPVGPAGAQGPVGPQGATGSSGAIGETGAVGQTGSSGATGETGAVGQTGAQGSTGSTGAAGSNMEAVSLGEGHEHPGGTYISNAGDYVSVADWDAMETVKVELGEFSFTPSNLTFEAGKPYKLEIVNAGAVKHYFTAEEFYGAVAFRKAQTSEGEFKAPFFKAIEVFPDDQVDLYFVAVVPGTYDSICTITGHADVGMVGAITITGSVPASPAPVVAAVADGDWVQNASDLVSAADWDTMQTVTVELSEFAFGPETLNLTVGQPYKIEIVNTGTVKHYFTAGPFYQSVAFRKAQDSSGEIKAPYFKAVEIFPGKQADLYLIPTQAGSFKSVCTIEGHQEAGMHGQIIVSES